MSPSLRTRAGPARRWSRSAVSGWPAEAAFREQIEGLLEGDADLPVVAQLRHHAGPHRHHERSARSRALSRCGPIASSRRSPSTWRQPRNCLSVEIDPPRGLNPSTCLAGAELVRDAGADAVNVGDSPMARVRMSALAPALIPFGEDKIPERTTRPSCT